MQEKGQLSSLKARLKIKPPECSPLLAEGRPLSLAKINFPFFVALSGMIFSAMILLCETVYVKLSPINTEKSLAPQIIEIDHSKSEVKRTVLQLKDTLKNANNLDDEWNWLDDVLIKLNNSSDI
jgi:hypothetical protein